MLRSLLALLTILSGAAAQTEGAQKPGHRLEKSPSPYLRQHADDPVEWYPWGPEAFEAARKQGKPIFLSIGYSACHWCHVMQRESFQHADPGWIRPRSSLVFHRPA